MLYSWRRGWGHKGRQLWLGPLDLPQLHLYVQMLLGCAAAMAIRQLCWDMTNTVILAHIHSTIRSWGHCGYQ